MTRPGLDKSRNTKNRTSRQDFFHPQVIFWIDLAPIERTHMVIIPKFWIVKYQ
jgi:hypothetical protein